MRPCHGCGAALQNNIVTCPDCGASRERGGLESSAPQPVADPGDDDRWLWMSYLFFPLLVGVFGGIFGVTLWGGFGVLLGIPVGLIALMFCLGLDLI